MCRAIVKPPTPRSPMRPFKRIRLAAALTLVSFQLLASSAQSQDGTKPGPRERVVEDTRAAPYIAYQRPEIADEASQPRSVLGIQVRTKTEEAVGRIIDLLADRDGKVVAAVIEFGGFLGIGTRKIAVEWSALRIEVDKSPVAILDVTHTSPTGPQRYSKSISRQHPRRKSRSLLPNRCHPCECRRTRVSKARLVPLGIGAPPA